jgi:hypothetical protein
MVATEVSPLDHEPPELALVSVVLNPTHIFAIPPIMAGLLLTVITAVVLQPVGSVYVIVDVPPAMPVTTPVEELMLAAVGLPLSHVPPDEVLFKLEVPPMQTVMLPVIAAGSALIVTTAPCAQPVPIV